MTPLTLPDRNQAEFGPPEYVRALLNILEDSASERTSQLDTHTALLNILEDFGTEKDRLLETQKAVLNILEDLAAEKSQLQFAQAEVIRSEQALRRSLMEKEVLLKEIHHRVKNNLQVISSLIGLQARHLTDPQASEHLQESQNRVRSIAMVHEKLYQSGDLSHIELSEYLDTLVTYLFQTFNAAGRGITKVLEVQGRVTIDYAIPCGMIINELISNALKHAFPDGRRGTVRVWIGEVGDRLEMTVADDGIGLPADVEPESGQSLGLDLVFTFAKQIKADVQVTRDTGTCLRFTFPLPK